MGGGHGLYGSLSALRHVTPNLTAVVTVADDGGSSGRLREEMGILLPAICAWLSRRCVTTPIGAAPGATSCNTVLRRPRTTRGVPPELPRAR